MSGFSANDAQAILNILENQASQNLKVARELLALQTRFAVHVNDYFNSPTKGADGKSPEA